MNYPVKETMNVAGRLFSLQKPLVMGILNVTPDSFSDGGKFNDPDTAITHAEKMLSEGADILDIGGYSSRPGADNISDKEELERVQVIVNSILKEFPKAIISIDTFRPEVAQPLLDAGIHIINDITAGTGDPSMMKLVAQYNVPYIMMHMQGTPQTMQTNPEYENVSEEILDFLVERINMARSEGIKDLIIDPGFGFGKTLGHNYEIFRNLHTFNVLGLPVLIGISRKSMLYKPFGTSPDDVMEITSAMHLQALMQGVKILRVHDVSSAKRVVQLYLGLEHGAF